MPEELEPGSDEGGLSPSGGCRPPVEPEALSEAERLALLASYVQPDGRLRIPGLDVVDDQGNERIVLGVHGRSASVTVRVSPVWTPVGPSEVAISADDGNDEDLYAFPPSVRLDLTTGGDVASVLSADLTTGRGVFGAGTPNLHLAPWFSPDP